MAVTRITATKRWFRKAATTMDDHPRTKRELLKGEIRYGLTVELMDEEVRILAQRLPKDQLAQQALADIEASEARERERPTGYEIIQRFRERMK